jgi:hypothetical protein
MKMPRANFVDELAENIGAKPDDKTFARSLFGLDEEIGLKEVGDVVAGGDICGLVVMDILLDWLTTVCVSGGNAAD